MTVYTPCYCSRTDVQRAIDFTDGQLTVRNTDRAIQDAARAIEGALHRRFWPLDTTRWWDFPNDQYAVPWRLHADDWDICALTAISSGGVSIPLGNVFLYPLNPQPGFPWQWIELDRSSTSTFGGNAPTPQAAISVTGTFGFTARAGQVTTLAASASSSDTTVTVADSSQVSAGDLLILDYGRGSTTTDSLPRADTVASYTGERVLVQDVAWYDTGDTQSSGCTTALSSDNVLTPSGGTFYPGEVLLLDTEEMLITAAASSGALTVTRAWNSTVLATHSDAEIYAGRSLTVERGYAGTTAASQASGTAVYKHRVPSLIRDLAIAEALNRALQETSGYARIQGEGDSQVPAGGGGLSFLWAGAIREYGRKNRQRVI